MTEDYVAQAMANADLAARMYADALDDICARLRNAADRIARETYPHDDTNYGPRYDYVKHARGVVSDLVALPASLGVHGLLARAEEATDMGDSVIEMRRRAAWREAENFDDK